MAMAADGTGLVGYMADGGDGVVFSVLEPVLAGSVIQFSREDAVGAAANWNWTADADLAPGVRYHARPSGLVSEAEATLVVKVAPAQGPATDGAMSEPEAPVAVSKLRSASPQEDDGVAQVVGGGGGASQAASRSNAVDTMSLAMDEVTAKVAPGDGNPNLDDPDLIDAGESDKAPSVPVAFSDADDVLDNAALLEDGVAMLGGDDELINSGTIIGAHGVAIDMGDGDDRVLLQTGSRIYGDILLGAGDDELEARDVTASLTIDAGDGNDLVRAGVGDDDVSGGDGDDVLDGGAGDDLLRGGAGNDQLLGGDGDDLLYGGAGDDILSGGAGDDLLDGGDGDDRLNIGAGDTALGGAGDDSFIVTAGDSARLTINGGAGDDSVRLGGAGAGQLAATSGVENLVVSGGAWSVAQSQNYSRISIGDGASITSAITLDQADVLDIATGGALAVAQGAIIWAGASDSNGASVINNSGAITGAAAAPVLAVTAGATGALVINNHAGAAITGQLSPTAAAANGATITINNASVIEASGRVMDFRKFDANGATAIINNLAGGVITQHGDNTDVLRPGQNGVVNNWGTITTDASFAGGGDLIDFQSDTGGKVNNYAGGVLDGAKHAVTGDRAVTVVNHGVMIGRNGSAVNIDNDGSDAERVSISNYGVMQGRSAGLDDSDGDAIDVDGQLYLLNYGKVEGLGANGAHDGEPNVSEAIAFGGGTIVNDGEIIGYGRGVQVDNSGNQQAPAATLIVNRGLIEGQGHGPAGVPAEDAARFGLRGNEAINLIGDHDDEIINVSTGRIIGGVAMGGGNDRFGNSGLVTATGGAAIDMGDGDDHLTLYVGARVEGKILLGAGHDLVTGSAYDAGFDIDAGDGDDQIYIGDGDDRIDGGAGDDVIYSGGGADFIQGGAGADRLFGEAGDDVIYGGAGDDHINGGAGDDEIFAGDGDDLIIASDGRDRIDGGAGFDTLDLSAATGPMRVDMAAGIASGAGIGLQQFTGVENISFGDGGVHVTGGSGDDRFTAGAGDDVLIGGSGDDVLAGGDGADDLRGGSGDDQLDGGAGDDVLAGGSGDDVLAGGRGDDVLAGGSGADWLDGGFGDDMLSGGSGADAFVFARGYGKDVVSDFSSVDGDVIAFFADIASDFDSLMGNAAQLGDDVVFSFAAGDTLTLSNVSLNTLQADDFRFV